MTNFDVLMHSHSKLRGEFYDLRIEFNEKLARLRAFIYEAGEGLREAKEMPALFDLTVNKEAANSDTIIIKDSKILVK